MTLKITSKTCERCAGVPDKWLSRIKAKEIAEIHFELGVKHGRLLEKKEQRKKLKV